MVVSPDPTPPPPGQEPSASAAAAGLSAAANLKAALSLLMALRRGGLCHAVICPGSRSAPLAVAAALLEPAGLTLHTAIDERSAAFFALGLGRAEGIPAAVITTSGSAVANLLPACVEADYGAIPLLLLSADRPDRLKDCGANQSVNQHTFLRHSCRWFSQGPGDGLAALGLEPLERLAQQALRHCLGHPGAAPPGAVHLNLPFEEPLHADAASLRQLAATAEDPVMPPPSGPDPVPGRPDDGTAERSAQLDPDRAGLVVAGPWRGNPAHWPAHLAALIRWQRRSGWPVLADALSGLRGCRDLECVAGYDLLLETPPPFLAAPQVLRLGPLPASRRLERWLAALGGRQVLVSEGDPRRLDPLARVAAQCSSGLAAWVDAMAPPDAAGASQAGMALGRAWRQAEARLQERLDQELVAPGAAPAAWSEPALARQLSRLLPAGLPLMLANSSPVRDWESFADPATPARPVFGFRGASGIDGTLSEACGVAEALGACLLLSGDLALLHDSNGWLWRSQLRGRLSVVLIDNGGGGIFEQLPIRAGDEAAARSPFDFERLFAMPQAVDPLVLAAAHGVPARRLERPAELPLALSWALEQPLSLLLVSTDRRRDAELRRRLRTMATPARAP